VRLLSRSLSELVRQLAKGRWGVVERPAARTTSECPQTPASAAPGEAHRSRTRRRPRPREVFLLLSSSELYRCALSELHPADAGLMMLSGRISCYA
jgi:hypothetical protein